MRTVLATLRKHLPEAVGLVERFADARRKQAERARDPDYQRKYRAEIHKVQAMVRKYIPEGVSLVDELIAERRAEARAGLNA